MIPEVVLGLLRRGIAYLARLFRRVTRPAAVPPHELPCWPCPVCGREVQWEGGDDSVPFEPRRGAARPRVHPCYFDPHFRDDLGYRPGREARDDGDGPPKAPP